MSATSGVPGSEAPTRKQEDAMQPTNPLDVAVPVEMVELNHLRTKSGEKVVVRCEALDEVAIVKILRALPGERPKPPKQGEDDPSPEVTLSQMAVFDEYAPHLIEAGAVLVDADGHDVRPAFWFDASKPRAPLSLPGRLLRVEDRVLLVERILTLSGYGGAAGASFHGGKRAGRGGRVRVVATRKGRRRAPVRSHGAKR